MEFFDELRLVLKGANPSAGHGDILVTDNPEHHFLREKNSPGFSSLQLYGPTFFAHKAKANFL